jgi:hypothetical protein
MRACVTETKAARKRVTFLTHCSRHSFSLSLFSLFSGSTGKFTLSQIQCLPAEYLQSFPGQAWQGQHTTIKREETVRSEFEYLEHEHPATNHQNYRFLQHRPRSRTAIFDSTCIFINLCCSYSARTEDGSSVSCVGHILDGTRTADNTHSLNGSSVLNDKVVVCSSIDSTNILINATVNSANDTTIF